jgi:predicted enzyme related to lactoylglutathione lyase
MHKSRLGALIVDCHTDDLFRDSDFWSAVFGMSPESRGEQRAENYVRFEGRPGEVQVILQKVDHPSRVHIDIETDDKEAEVKRLEALGAVVVAQLKKWTVLEAPSGHRFCVIGPIRAGFEENANTWE